ETVTVKSNEKGLVDLEHLKEVVGDDTAALMLTNPNTLGLFETEIMDMAKIVHGAGGKLYYDGANLNAIMGYVRPVDIVFYAVHLNLQKTVTGPHGGGGPYSGPIGVSEELATFLPKPLINRQDEKYGFNYDVENSIGRIKPYYGNFGINLRAYTYIRTMGPRGLKQASEDAVINANYLMRKLSKHYELPYPVHCKHEFVLSGSKQKKLDVRTLDVSKRHLYYGYHPSTIYFPLNVEEAMMVEPTETDFKETFDGFIEAMEKIATEIEEEPKIVQEAPHETIVGRMDE